MPGHKGKILLGLEKYDLTEINGADVLYDANGIIAESENNLSTLFNTQKSLFSTQGSSLCISAMLYLVSVYAKSMRNEPLVLAYRNVHKSFISGVALLDLNVEFIYPNDCDLISCDIELEKLEKLIKEKKPTALYVTSPDYLGKCLNIGAIAKLCHENGTLLVCDNAHGAYRKFLEPSLHPMDLGADLCCDSAHKTLPVLTGGAYLHVSKTAPKLLANSAKSALSLFASTSPSYLTLSSLDLVNKHLESNFPKKLKKCADKISVIKKKLVDYGYCLYGEEPLKLTIKTKSFGYLGTELAKILENKNIFCEFCDNDYIVFMLSPSNSNRDFKKLEKVLLSIKKRVPITTPCPKLSHSNKAMSIRDAIFSPQNKVPIEQAEGKILASPCVSCPPAIPIAICGEIINKDMIECFKYYGIDEIFTVQK